MIEARVNIRQMAKDMYQIGPKVLALAGEELTAGIWEEFEVLVKTTAQYTGTTAASWNIGLMGKGMTLHGQVRVMGLGPDQEPLRVGHGVAVSIALNANATRLDDISKKVMYSGINVWNESPGIQVAEEGPLRSVNDGALGAFARFEHRMATKVIAPMKGDVTVTELLRMGR